MSARDLDSQQVTYLFTSIKGPNPLLDAAQQVYVGVLPAGCFPLDLNIRVLSTMDKSIVMGTSAAGSSTLFLQAADVTAGTTGSYVVNRGVGYYSSVDTPVYVQTATTGASTGEIQIWWPFLPAN
jgi:hypothetical protein